MKLTKDGKTLFTALCEMFVNKVGHSINRRAFGDYASLVATRNTEGSIQSIDLSFRKSKDEVITVLTIDALANELLVDATGWFTQATINRLNKVLSMVEMNIRKFNGQWVIEDKAGQMAQFQNGALINLSRPHGAAIYAPVETPTVQS